jgi:DHA2 family multidrug resistance protein-like MFS transporter
MAFAGGWGADYEVAIVLGVVSLLWAVGRLAQRHAHLHVPDLPYRVLGLTLFTGAVLALAQSGSLLQLSNFLKGVQGYGDLASGLAMAPYALTTLIASLAIGAIMARRYRGTAVELVAFRRPITAGLALVAVSLLLLWTLEPDTGYLLIGLALAILGAGASIANVPRTDLLFRSVRRDRAGVAAGLNGSAFLLGGALGNVAVTAMIAVSSAGTWQAHMVDAGMTPEQAAAVYQGAQRAVFLATAHPYNEPSYLDVASQVPGWDAVFTSGFTDAMLVLAAVTGVAVMVAFLGLRERRART